MNKRKLKCMITGMLISTLICNQFPITAERGAEVKAAIKKGKEINLPENTEQPTLLPTSEPVQTEKPAPKVIGVELKTMPSKLTYMMGEEFDIEGMILEATFDNGTMENVLPTSISSIEQKLGKQEIIITYEEYQFSIPITVTPAKVTDIFKSINSTKAITIEWTEATGAEEYEVYQYNADLKEYQLIGKTKKLKYKISNLEPTTEYLFKIKSIATLKDDIGEIRLESPMSDKSSICTKPLGVQDAQVNSQTDTTVNLEWAEVTGADGYNVYQYNSSKKIFELVGSSKNNTYIQKKLNSGSIYRYRIKAYKGEKDNTGSYSNLVKTGTLPAKVGISSIKVGTGKVRISWNKASGASGYYIYKSTKPNGNYEKVATIRGVNNISYELENLKNNTIYYFKVSAYKDIYGENKEGNQCAYVKKKVVSAKKTSTTAKNFKRWAQFKKSGAYKKYGVFKKSLVAGRTFVIPGITITNVRGFNSTSMCPQAICIAKKYMLMTAYDSTAEENSVIYVMDKKTRKYLTTIILPNKPHAGGLAYDGKNIWVSNGKKVASIRYSDIEAAVKKKVAYKEVSYANVCPVLTQASFMTYYDGKLWVGEYNEASSKNTYAYDMITSGEAISLKAVNRMTIPSRTQGMTFLKDGTLILSRSSQIYTWAKMYISRLEVYKPSKPTKTGYIRRNRMVTGKTMPPMAEGVVSEGNYLYLVFESAFFTGCEYPVDRICALKTKNILKTKK